MSAKAKIYLAAVYLAGVITAAMAVSQWSVSDPIRFVSYLLIALLASSLKVSLPGINGSMSVNFFFIILGVMELSLPETLIIGCGATLVQSHWKVHTRPKLVQITFNLANMSTAIVLASTVFNVVGQFTGRNMPLMLVAAACTYFVTNTLPVAIIIAFTEQKAFRKIWAECYFWSFPYYLVGAAIAGCVSYINRYVGWQTSLLALPVIYWIYRSYRLYLGRLEDEKRHVENMAALHLRTIEALALAIEAKDHTTHDHLQRVRVYALEVAKELNLNQKEVEALRAASLLHDIGKLAIPEHIINKPGKLTPEEFEKMKIHPLVGAEILERVNFPYPVVPIVRAHHEKYDGSGYPFGLKGEEIPIGARILAAVDCLDALASDRQYRRAVPLQEAMQQVARQAGKAFDPRVVDVLQRRYVELEHLAQQKVEVVEKKILSTDVKIDKGAAPDAGFEQTRQENAAPDGSFLTSIAAARQEAQTLFELSHELGNSLSLDETLSVLSIRLRKLVPFDSFAIYVLRDGKLIPEHVSGDNFRLFSSLEIPLGQGLSGWVAANRKPIVNGDPSVEPGYLNDSTKFSTLRSAISVPLEGVIGVLGVLSLYKAEPDAFTQDHLRILLAISSKVALSIENALKYQQAESSATTDYLTGLPNARSLFLHLDQELARCRRTNASVAVMVCDLDGFKQINDRFGHIEGNKVLRIFANKLRSVCREYDYVARMGGDEFIIIAPGLTREAADEKALILNELAVDSGREVCKLDILSVSVGTAFFSEDGMDAEQLLAEADRRMYIVKQIHHEKMETAPEAGTRFSSLIN
ncbi:MAG TPA: HD domain-containing phosphohydrolase [Terriglobales bacterium]|nr:HD domain-containing phosphohydrolase [Terriglobales bacterium]